MSEEADAVARPRRVARRRAFLEAATSVFLEKGYANATLDDIIARSGGSRQTLYSLFGGKQGLFEALIAELCDKVFAPFRAEGLLDQPPGEVLVEVGIRYLETVTTPDALGVYRLVVAGCLHEGVGGAVLGDGAGPYARAACGIFRAAEPPRNLAPARPGTGGIPVLGHVAGQIPSARPAWSARGAST
jgi:AcrR family transcriptional regulator